MKAIITLLTVFVLVTGYAQQTTQPVRKRKILLENATLHVGNGTVFEKGLVGIEGDRIILVRNSLAYTYERGDWDTIIDLDGQHLYPGFMAPNSTLGLTELDAVRASRDFDEVGFFNPHVRSLIAYNCESNVLATVRTNGVLLTQSTPRGGAIPGSSSIMVTDCWNWEDGVVLADDGIHLNWPSSLEGGWGDQQRKRNEKYGDQKRQIADFFASAKAYYNSDATKKDLRYEAMRACIKGTKRVYFHANELQELLDVIDFAKTYGIAFPVIVGGYDSYMITDRLKDANIPVMLPRLHSLPQNENDPVDLLYRLPGLLQSGGVKFCLQNEGDMEAMNARNIPFLAGTAMSYGLTEEEAIRCVSLSACEIVGIDEWYGSIEEGKKATLFVSSGNALDMRTNNVTLILINGLFSGTTNFQTELYLKYKKKYGL
jgi:imidazolonepropionase-like amidohydrolase